MNEREYADIAAACDRLLRAPDTSLERLAIPLLHLINEHPSCTAQYESVLSSSLGRSPSALTNPARTAARVGRALLRSTRRVHFQSPQMGPVDVLIVSHVSNRALLDRDDDFYFGAMQRLLLERGATSALVLVNHLYDEDPQSALAIRPFPVARVLLPRTVAPRIEAGIWRRCWAIRGRMRQVARSSRNTLEGAMALLASRHALAGATAANLRLHASISEICELLKPRIVVTTYEGDASERMIWQAARGGGRRPLCVGYQHTRLLQRAHAIRRSVQAPGIDCDPDVVLTLGEIPHAMLAASPGLAGVRLIPYGSHRRAESKQPVSAKRARLCLVLPDGDERESVILFEFALACARRMPQMTFALRPHPGVNPTILDSRSKTLGRLPGNVILSLDRTLAQDCGRAGYCLYRGSSAAIHAVLAGVKPFYLARADELPFDTLAGMPEWRETLTSPEEFSVRVAATPATVPDAARSAWNYCDRYVLPVRPAAIDELLELSLRKNGT